jgi:hypothetical protein
MDAARVGDVGMGSGLDQEPDGLDCPRKLRRRIQHRAAVVLTSLP